MPTSSRHRTPDLLVDSSAAVALVVADHADHEVSRSALAGRSLGLAGHAWFETYSVLTRLPGPARRDPATVAELLTDRFPHSRFLDAAGTQELTGRLAVLGIAGGAVYDALVGLAAVQHKRTLATRDRRALDTYRAVDAAVELIS